MPHASSLIFLQNFLNMRGGGNGVPGVVNNCVWGKGGSQKAWLSMTRRLSKGTWLKRGRGGPDITSDHLFPAFFGSGFFTPSHCVPLGPLEVTNNSIAVRGQFFLWIHIMDACAFWIHLRRSPLYDILGVVL